MTGREAWTTWWTAGWTENILCKQMEKRSRKAEKQKMSRHLSEDHGYDRVLTSTDS